MVEFRVLGPLEVLHEGRPVNIGGPRQATLLSALLLEQDSIVPVNRLFEALWDEDPPRTARNQVQIAVSSIRHSVSAASGRNHISTQHPGYVLRLGEDTLDARDFETSVAQARRLAAAGEDARAVEEYDRALAMWRGSALSGIDSPLIQRAVVNLEELRIASVEERVEAELRAEPRQQTIGELIGLSREYPLREHLQALLITALHTAGRRAEALEVYRGTRATLIDQLGIEPGPELRRLHLAILNNDHVQRSDAHRAPAAASGPAVAHRRVAQTQPAAARPEQPGPAVPRMLPAAMPDFTGRHTLLAALVGTGAPPADSVRIVYGRGGVGKTALAVQAAHRLAPSHPDGQLFARLRSGNHPVNPANVFERFLRLLGVDSSSIPEDLEQRAELYRNVLGDRRVLIVLDDAVSEQQVMQLLPGNPNCSVLVTSRRRLTGIPATSRHEVPTMSKDTAVELLTRILGPQRIDAEPEAVHQLCDLCGNLPLALRIAAARLADRPHWAVADQVERLRDSSRRLEELNHGGLGLRASIALTYDTLSPDARRLFRLLAISDSPSFASWVAAPLLQADVHYAQELLEELAEAYLIDTERTSDAAPVRYRFHDIVRPFARERLVMEEGPQDRQAALERLTGALVFLAREAHIREYSGDYLLPTSGAARWPLPRPLVDRLLHDPLAWYEQERHCLSAAVRQAAAAGLAEHAWELAISCVALYETRSYFADWRETHEAALRAVCRARDQQGEAAIRYSLGSLFMFEQQNSPAMRHFQQALALYRKLGEDHGAALVLRNMAVLDRRGGKLAEAVERWEEALAVFEVVGDQIAEAHVRYSLAQVHLDCGDDGAAARVLERAEEICERTGNQRVGAQVQKQIGELRIRAGELDRAARAYTNVLAATRTTGDQVGECYGMIGLASVDLRRGNGEAAMRALLEALALAEVTGDHVVRCRSLLALVEADMALGRPEMAATHAETAVPLAREVGANLLIAQALVARACVHEAAAEPEQARELLYTPPDGRRSRRRPGRHTGGGGHPAAG